MSQTNTANSHRASGPSPDELREIVQALTGLRFGVVQVIVQDGVVVQIDRTEKRRLRSKKPTE